MNHQPEQEYFGSPCSWTCYAQQFPRRHGTRFIGELHGIGEHIEVVDGGVIVLTEHGVTKVPR